MAKLRSDYLLKLRPDGSIDVLVVTKVGPVFVRLEPETAGAFFGAGMRLVGKWREMQKRKPLPGQRSIYDELN